MDACMDACCGSSPRRTVSELFDRGLRRARLLPLPIVGDAHTGAGGLSVRFSLACCGGRIENVHFTASTCITLIAYCELIAEVTSGQRITEAMQLTTADLVRDLPNVPALKRDRAPLAIAAFRAALINETGNMGESVNEGRLHFRNAAP
jgi:hypothetical protein